jgi:hypothetical protein
MNPKIHELPGSKGSNNNDNDNDNDNDGLMNHRRFIASTPTQTRRWGTQSFLVAWESFEQAIVWSEERWNNQSIGLNCVSGRRLSAMKGEMRRAMKCASGSDDSTAPQTDKHCSSESPRWPPSPFPQYEKVRGAIEEIWNCAAESSKPEEAHFIALLISPFMGERRRLPSRHEVQTC